MKVFYGVLAILCIHSVYSQATPSLSDIIITQKSIKYFGRVAELTCLLSKSTELPVVWTKVDINRVNEPVVISNGSTLLIDDSRFSFEEISYTNNTLQIKNIEINDAGFYQCHISSGLNTRKSAEVELVVRIPPKIFDIMNRSLVFNQSEVAKLECNASGYPIPRISWRRENSAVLPTGGSLYRGNVLYIPWISKDDRGTYYCIAENGVSPADQRSIGVEVEYSPYVTAAITEYFQFMGHDVDLDCTIEANPPAVIVWIKDGVELSNKEHYKVTNVTTGHKTDVTLHIFNLQRERFGYYICQATNILGNEALLFRLDPAVPQLFHVPGPIWN